MNIDTMKILLEEGEISAEQFEERNLLNIISVGIFLIGGPLFIYFGFYLLTSPITVKWGFFINSDRFPCHCLRLQSLAGSADSRP